VAKHFFSALDPTAAFIAALMAFAAGFLFVPSARSCSAASAT
jgi:hypothetical protein